MLGTVGFATLVACRIALGAGEGPAYPVALHSAYKWFPNKLRTLPTAIIAQGAGIGIMVALPVLNWVIVTDPKVPVINHRPQRGRLRVRHRPLSLGVGNR